MNNCNSFPPGIGEAPELLILGSMPGEESLRREQYYAFKHNVFWRIMGEILGFDPGIPYPERLNRLRLKRIALWDVLASCERAGSLDAAIRRPEPNDISGLLKAHPTIVAVCCNGATAGRYLKRFFPELPVKTVLLPSTSPAAARLSFEEKLAVWREALTAGRRLPGSGSGPEFRKKPDIGA